MVGNTYTTTYPTLRGSVPCFKRSVVEPSTLSPAAAREMVPCAGREETSLPLQLRPDRACASQRGKKKRRWQAAGCDSGFSQELFPKGQSQHQEGGAANGMGLFPAPLLFLPVEGCFFSCLFLWGVFCACDVPRGSRLRFIPSRQRGQGRRPHMELM